MYDPMEWNIPAGRTIIPEDFLKQGYTPLLAALLYARGFRGPAEAAAFLDCGATSLGDPMAMADMPLAVARIWRAIKEREHVAVYGDYDVDGITSSCMLTDYLRKKGVPCELYIPDRMEEGYGVNSPAIRTLWEKGVQLVITVDCGITAVEETEYANALGVEMIITDHHECRERLPDAVAVVDPKRPDCFYPNKNLAGVGVAFKLLCALEENAETMLDRYGDLVAFGTVADVMPLTGENRYIVRKGLEKLEKNPSLGLKALMAEAGLRERKLTAAGIGYTLAPRLNASGRLGQVDSAVGLLLTEQPRKAAAYAELLCSLNRERQEMELEIWNAALEMIQGETPSVPIVLAREGWHQGVVGIVASRLTESFHVPAVMICLDGEKCKGSCRSVSGFNLFEALNACAEYLEGFGGHALAAGLTVRRENVDAFRTALGAYYLAHPGKRGPALNLDLCVDTPELLAMDCVDELERMEPCGSGNPRPQLCFCGACLAELTPIGGGKHLRVRLKKFGLLWEAVFFGQTLEELGLRTGDWVDAAFHPQINQYRGRKNVQLVLTGLRRHIDSGAQAVLRGAALREVGEIPGRSDCAAVWRALAGAGGRYRERIPAMTERLAPWMREEKFCLILKIFEELGLLALNVQNGVLSVRQNPNAGKKALSESKILQRLNGAEAEFRETH